MDHCRIRGSLRRSSSSTAGRKSGAAAMSWVPDNVRTEVDDCGQAAWVTLSGYTRHHPHRNRRRTTGRHRLDDPPCAVSPRVGGCRHVRCVIPVIGAPIATLFAAVVATRDARSHHSIARRRFDRRCRIVRRRHPQPSSWDSRYNRTRWQSSLMIASRNPHVRNRWRALLAVPIGGTIYWLAKYSLDAPCPYRLQPHAPKPQLPHWLKRRKNEEGSSSELASGPTN